MIASLALSSKKKKRTAGSHSLLDTPPVPHSHDHDPSIPSVLDFNVMLSTLRDWKEKYGSCIVPHRCFDDSMGLGPWVRWMRRQRRTGLHIDKWKILALDEVGFEWSVPREEAKWSANFHHYRHWKSLRWDGGLSASVDLPTELGMSDPQLGWSRELDAWLLRQGRDLVNGKLSVSKRRALEAVGATLTVAWEDFERGVSVQGLNGHERKRLRQLWRATEVEEEPVTREDGCNFKLRELEREERERERRERARRRWVRSEAARASRLAKHPLLSQTDAAPQAKVVLQPPLCDGE